jgi:hypothetical protein
MDRARAIELLTEISQRRTVCGRARQASRSTPWASHPIKHLLDGPRQPAKRPFPQLGTTSRHRATGPGSARRRRDERRTVRPGSVCSGARHGVPFAGPGANPRLPAALQPGDADRRVGVLGGCPQSDPLSFNRHQRGAPTFVALAVRPRFGAAARERHRRGDRRCRLPSARYGTVRRPQHGL